MYRPRRMVKKVGKYELGRTLGEGTFGKVKYAVNLETNEAVAIKVLDKSVIQKQNMGNQIKREISIMKMVKHKYIVEMIEVLASKTKIFIVLELVSGGELFDRIIKAGKLTEEEALFYFNQLIEGVDYCHNLGVCHRDLKPENLLLDDHGNLKISDFGLSSLYVGDAESDGTSRTEILHTTCGTPNYVAPEVLADNGYDGKKADVWSIGVILYVLLAGFLPFDEKTIVALFDKIQKAEFTYPMWFSVEARAVIDSMLVTDPKERVTLSSLRQNDWLKRYQTNPNAPMGDQKKDGGDSDVPLSVTQLEAVVQAVTLCGDISEVRNRNVHADVGTSAEEAQLSGVTGDDYDDDDWGDVGLPNPSGSGPRLLNAFDLVSQCGGFRVDKMFSPHLYASSETQQRSAFPHSSSNLKLQLDGILRFGSSFSASRVGKFNFTSPVGAEKLLWSAHRALVDMGCSLDNSEEDAISSGRMKATHMTSKGMIGICIQVYILCPTLNLLEIRRGKGDILEWNKVYNDLVGTRIASLINKVESEGEAKSFRS